MAENTEQAFFTKKHSRLANIASLAKIIGWIYLVVGLIGAIAYLIQAIDSYLPNLQGLYPSGDFIVSAIRNFLQPIIYWLVLMSISAGLNMIIETDLNYRGAAEDGEEPAEGNKPKAMRAIVTETARVLKGTFHKKSAGPTAEDDPNLKFTEGEQPVFYDPRQVLWLDKWLGIAAIVSMGRYILNAALIVNPNQEYFSSLFGNSAGMGILPWVGTLLYSLLNLGVQFLFIFFSMIALGTLLKVLMEMEFNSRGGEE